MSIADLVKSLVKTLFCMRVFWLIFCLLISINFRARSLGQKLLEPIFGGTRELFVQIDQNDSDRLGLSGSVIQN